MMRSYWELLDKLERQTYNTIADESVSGKRWDPDKYILTLQNQIEDLKLRIEELESKIHEENN